MEERKEGFFSRLGKLFSSNIVVVNVGGKKLKVMDVDMMQSFNKTATNILYDKFNRLYRSPSAVGSNNFTGNFPYLQQRLSLFNDYELMDCDPTIATALDIFSDECIGPDTIIPTPDNKNLSIEELSKLYPNEDTKFYVYSYDEKSKSIKLGNAHSVRKTKTEMTYKIIFDDGKYIVATDNHPFLMRDGNYRQVKDLQLGDSVMPFYQRNFWGDRYRHLYNFSNGWQSEHKIIAEQFYGKLSKNEVVHHIDFDKENNMPDNLKIMKKQDHSYYHRKIINKKLWSPENYEKQCLSIKNGIKNGKKHKWDGARKGENNPFFNKKHKIQTKQIQSEKMIAWRTSTNYDGINNPNYRDDVSFEKIVEKSIGLYKQYGKITLENISNEFNCHRGLIWTRLKQNNFENWKSFKDEVISTLNHKIVAIEPYKVIDVYDMTVDEYHNFATDSCFVHNCSTKNEYGDILTIKSNDENIKKILYNLFYDVLNIQFNLWPWTRNMLKYGDTFLKLDITEKFGIVNVVPMSPYEVTREEGFDPQNPFDVRFRQEGAFGAFAFKNYEIAHFRLLSDTNFAPYGKCLSGNSKIWTTTGVKQIKNIKQGDLVYSFDFNTSKTIKSPVLNTVMSGIKPVYEIKTCHRKIKATAEHPFLLSTGKYKTIEELTINDYLILPTLSDDNIEYPKLIVEETDKWKYDNKLKIISEDTLKNNFKEFVKFFGFMLGDGWLDKSNNTVCFSLGDRLDKSQKYVDFLDRLNINHRIIHQNTTKATCIVHSVYLYKLFEQLDFITGSHNKIVPSWIWSLPNDYKKAFIFGLGDADGCYLDDNFCQIIMVNENIINNVRELCMQVGFSVTNVWGENYKGIKFGITSRDMIDIDSKYHIEKIRKIKYVGKEEVYDIQVDNNLHNFIANGIVVHNSIIEPARKIWKMLTLMEDAMLIHRIMRAPERRIFYIDVGNIAPNEVESYMNTMINSMKKTPFVDQRTGDYNLRFNIMNMLEDYYMPVRGASSNTKIETLPGMTFNGMEDIEYLRKRLLSSIRMPNPFLGYEETVEGKATLAALDVRFGRTIERIQQALQSELVKIAVIHLYSQGYTDAKLIDFELSLTQPSTIYESEKINLWSEKIRVAKDFFDSKLFSDDWIYQNIFNLSDDEIVKEKAKVIEGQKLLFRKTQIESEGNDPLVSGESFGTPHDIAAMNLIYGKKQTSIDFGESEFNPNPTAPRPGGLWSNNPYSMQPVYQRPEDAGRPTEPSRYGTDSHPAGRNPLAHTDLSKTLDRDRSIVHKYANNSPLREMERDKSKMKLLFENNEIDKLNNSKLNELSENNGDYLDEKNIIPDETFK